MKKVLFFSFLFFLTIKLFSKDATIYLWRKIPKMKRQQSVMFMHKPVENVKNTKTAVIICPGGSYHHLGLYNEGYCSAKWFSQNGITAFTLKYRTNESLYKHPAMLEDIQRAIQIIRENADEYGIDPEKIGAIGYSAGGHLVTMASVFGDELNELEKLGITSEVSLRPNFCMPIYPVVSMQDDIGHKWSRKSLLGRKPTQEQKDTFSMELNIPEDMIPTFIVVAKDDPVVIPENSFRLYEALTEKNIPHCKMQVYEWGKHGFGMADTQFMREFHWNEELKLWLVEIGML